MSQALTFQQVILKLHAFWAARDCVVWSPYNVQVGAGTGNPATTLRVLGPEPWRAAYVEPSVRPDDGRYGDNPNRMQKYYQYQVILKPDPGNPQELYLESLAALGINQREHDIRFVEDNWESPALGAWGLGWEVWLDGQEITQFTYFQQAGGMTLEPVSVEITYGIERIVLALQGVESAWDIDWMDGVQYGDIMRGEEVEHCRYYFDVADVVALKGVYDAYEGEYARALEGGALISAYDYVLKCSHLFNVLDARGAVGVTERAHYFRRMREMTRTIAKVYVQKREALGHPLMKMAEKWRGEEARSVPSMPMGPSSAADALLEIGVEEMPAGDVANALSQLRIAGPALFADLRLEHNGIDIYATPRRIAIIARHVSPRQRDELKNVKGPPAARAYDAEGRPTRAALGFARGKGVDAADLTVREVDGGSYVFARAHTVGRPAIAVLSEALPGLLEGLKFGRSMRWNGTGVAFSRPIRWIAALFGDAVIPLSYAGVLSGRVTRGLRPYGSCEIVIHDARSYQKACVDEGILLDFAQRRASIGEQINSLAREIGGQCPKDDALLDEVANLVEAPAAFRGRFDERYLSLPRDVLVTVMRKHQRYFAVEDSAGNLLPCFIGVRNGNSERLDKVIHGNEQVIRARFSDASFFYEADIKKKLKDYLPRLDTLTFQADLGSMRAKNDRVAAAVDELGPLLGFGDEAIAAAGQAAKIAKADLATSMVVEMTALQGVMGREYALREGINPAVAQAIAEHWLPSGAGGELPASDAGRLLALADKLDSLVGLLAVGLAPKSTSDPYGLRRIALGILQILLQSERAVDLRPAIERVAESQPVAVGQDTIQQALDFLQARFENWIHDSLSVPRDVVKAVLMEQASNPYRAMLGIEELAEWTRRDDWEQILDSFARCGRITRGEAAQNLRPELLVEAQERALHEAWEAAAAGMDERANVGEFLQAFAGMMPVVTAFFDNVLVRSDDAGLRGNRIALLQKIHKMQNGRADFSALENY